MANRLVEALGRVLAPRLDVFSALRKSSVGTSTEAIVQADDEQNIAPGRALSRPDAATAGQGIMFGIFPSGQPPRRGERELHLAYNTMPYLRSAVALLARRISGTPWNMYTRRLSSGVAVKAPPELEAGVDRKYRVKALGRLKALGELEQMQTHPMLEFLKRGNLLLDGRLSLRHTAIAGELAGDAYWLIERSKDIANPETGLGLPIRYWPIPAFWVYQTPSIYQPYFRVSYGGWQGYIKEEDIVWFRDVNPAFPYGRGTGIAEALAKDLEWGDYASDFLRTLFANNAMPAGMVSIVGGTADQVDEFEQRFLDQHQGVERSNRMHFTGYDVKVETFDPQFAQGELSALIQLQRDSIRQNMHLPPEVFGELKNSNRSTIDAADYMLEKYAVEPKRDDLRHVLQRRLCPEWDPNIVIDYESEVPEDIDRRIKIFGMRPYAFSNDDVRDTAGVPAWGGADGMAKPPVPVAAPQEAEQIQTGGGLGGMAKRARGFRTKANGGGDQPASDDDAEPGPAIGTREREIVLQALQGLSVGDSLIEGMTEEIDAWIQRESSELGVDPVSFLRNPAVVEYVKAIGADEVKRIDDNTKDQIRAVLDDGIAKGLGAEAVADNLAAACDGMSDTRALTIARTEVGSAANWANLLAYKESGVVEARQWLCRLAQADPRDGGPKGDGPDHRALHKQTRPLDQPFVDEGTGAELDYPGDGDAEDRINCHCSTAPVVAAPAGFDANTAALWTARYKSAALDRYEKNLAGWRTRTEARLRKHFAEVKSAALRSLS